ncbi:MAG: hypothetical protein IKL55_02810 [Clostridia bacterium]|nr:hypothetical protein [Clostridia bacterium]
MNNYIDYMDLMDVAKINLMKKLNMKMDEYEKNPSSELKKEIINMSIDRKQLYSFDIPTIKKYL